MNGLVFVMCTLVVTSSGLLYIERCLTKSTKIAIWTAGYTHDAEGNSIANTTVKTLVFLKKAQLYITIKAAENDDDKEYKMTIIRTVADVEKTFKNLQSNRVMRAFMADLIKSMDFEVKFPLPPVSTGNGT